MEASFIYPINILKENPLIKKDRILYFIEDPAFFGMDPERKIKFHKNKLVIYRASMKEYSDKLKRKGYKTRYFDYPAKELTSTLKKDKVTIVHFIDPVDELLSNRVESQLKKAKIELKWYESPLFICSTKDLTEYDTSFRPNPNKFNQTSFYIWQRKRLNILLNKQNKPEGGKWSYDPENRKSLPNDQKIPKVPHITESKYIKDAKKYINKNFKSWYGTTDTFNYPTNHNSADKFLKAFVKEKLDKFGLYQDAIRDDNWSLFHSILSSSLNTGLITPMDVLNTVLKSRKASLEDLEGFVRQIIGWREFMRYVYVFDFPSTNNFLGNKRKLTKDWYIGTTGIKPLDDTIKNAFERGYLHHIERLMIVGNLMNLCGISPDEAYKWFMEFAVDSYDWVMIGNVYGMAMFSDTSMTSKPYISTSNYLLKMSNYSRNSEGLEIWDALFYNFLGKHKIKLNKIHRAKLLLSFYKKKSRKEKDNYKKIAKRFISQVTK